MVNDCPLLGKEKKKKNGVENKIEKFKRRSGSVQFERLSEGSGSGSQCDAPSPVVVNLDVGLSNFGTLT